MSIQFIPLSLLLQQFNQTILPFNSLICPSENYNNTYYCPLTHPCHHLLSITGPYSVNGVPLRRVNQRYVIATNTSVSLAGVNVSAIEDAFFAREKVTKKVMMYFQLVPTLQNNGRIK